MHATTCPCCSPSWTRMPGIPLWTALTLAAFLVLACGGVTPTARAEDKPAPVTTVLPAVPLGAQQLADLAAKGVPAAAAPVLVMPTTTARVLRTVGPPTGLARIVTKDASAKPRRLPGVSEALGPIPRESWIREALGKRPDVAVVGGRAVKIEPAGAPR
jgi:hypothetical protein